MRISDEPGKPRDVKATDWDKDHVDLAWQPPESDGGSKIFKYILEKKDRFGDWTPATEVPIYCIYSTPFTKRTSFSFRFLVTRHLALFQI